MGKYVTRNIVIVLCARNIYVGESGFVLEYICKKRNFEYGEVSYEKRNINRDSKDCKYSG